MTDGGKQGAGPSRASREQERFMLRRPGEIVTVLNQLAKRPEIITAYFDAGRRHLITAVLAVQPESQSLILDMGPNESINRLVVQTPRVICLTKHQSVSVKFPCGPLRLTEFNEQPAFLTALPEMVYRLQRREFFRVPTPVTSPVLCRLHGQGQHTDVNEFRAVDLSVGGLGLVDLDMTLRFEPRARINVAELVLPGSEVIQVQLELRNISRHIQRDGRVGRRLGLAFIGLQPRHATTIQRYLHQLQLVQRDTRPDDD
jgi:flagellar brake protein